MRIGIARANITPPSRIELVGFAGRGETVGVHDPLYATALVASEGQRSTAIVSCDLIGVRSEFTDSVCREVEKSTGLPCGNLAIACTHTHYGPGLHREASTPRDSAYQENLKYVLSDLVAEASANQQDAVIGVGFGESDIGINRREHRADGTVWLGQNPDGTVDRSVGVCRIDSVQGKPIAVLVNFATHPVVQGGSTCHISADYPGVTRRVVEESTGATCLFLQGAGANINPIRMEPSFEPVELLGGRLGKEVQRVWKAIRTGKGEGVSSAIERVNLPLYRYGSRENAERIASELEKELEGLKNDAEANHGEVWWVNHRLEKVRSAVDAWKGGGAEHVLQTEFRAFTVGPLALAFSPGEIFNELGSAVKAASPFDNTFFVAYTCDSIGYVPNREAYAEGGYEVTHACRVDPEASDILVETCGRLLKKLSK